MICVALLLCRGALELLKSFFKCHLGSTWTSQKPIAVLNTNGFYDALLVLLETMMKKLFGS
jgi:predicted Rossmann-fold nucleotide-binding protein